MITFKQHIEISKGLSVDDDGMLSVEEKNLVKRLELIKGIQEVYPLKDSKRITPYLKENFKVHKNVRELVLGQFIMLEQILTGKQRYPSEAEMELGLLQLLLRPKHHGEFDNTNPLEEQQHKENILNSPVQDVYNLLNRYLDNREKTLFTEFAGVFYEVNEDTGEEKEKVEDTGSTAVEFHSQWYWYSIVRMLGQEDIRRYAEIYMLNMNVVLPEMSYLAQKNKVESAQRRQDAALSKL